MFRHLFHVNRNEHHPRSGSLKPKNSILIHSDAPNYVANEEVKEMFNVNKIKAIDKKPSIRSKLKTDNFYEEKDEEE